MPQDDREHLELKKLQIETRNFVAETRILLAEETKLKREAFWSSLQVHIAGRANQDPLVNKPYSH
jgi:hypothetical protein